MILAAACGEPNPSDTCAPGAPFQTPSNGEFDTPVLLATGQSRAWQVAADATHVYWIQRPLESTDTEPWHLRRVPRSGGDVEELVATPVLWDFVLDDNDVIFSAGLPPNNGIFRVAKSGGAPVEISPAYAIELYLSGDELFGANNDGVVSVAKTGGQPVTVARWEGRSLLEFDDSSIYAGVGWDIAKISKLGGAWTTLASFDFLPDPNALDADSIYVFDDTYGQVWSVPKCGGDAVLLTTFSGFRPRTAVVDDGYVYAAGWSDTAAVDGGPSSYSIIYRIPKQGGEPVAVVTGAQDAWELAVDASGIYWTTDNAGEVWMAPRR
jgi:hypothetical protein